MPWRCFMVSETDREMRWLRRYAHREESRPDLDCPHPANGGYHQAHARIEDGPASWETDHGPIENTDPPRYYHGSPPLHRHISDPRWPERCLCGRPFAQTDEWQVFTEIIYRAENGAEWMMRRLPAGAMFDAAYQHAFRHVGPDGLALTVMLPPAYQDLWCVDGPSSSGGGWTRTGTPPAVTVSPSILTSRYHGFLQNGVLTDCLPDRSAALAAALETVRARRALGDL